MSSITQPRRSAWLAAVLLGALATAGFAPAQARDLVSPGGDAAACAPRNVVIPGGGLPQPGPGLPLPTPLPTPLPDPVRPLPPVPGDTIGAAGRSVSAERGGDAGAPLTYAIEELPKAEFDDWGATEFYAPVVSLRAVCLGGVWKASVKSATQPIKQGVRMLVGFTDLTPKVLEATTILPGPPTKAQRLAACTTLARMATDLRLEAAAAGDGTGPNTARPGPKYYMLPAVQAHEDLHVTQHKTDVATPFSTLKAAVRQIAGVKAPSEAAALRAMRTPLDDAEREFAKEARKAALETAAHRPSRDPFRNAEQAVVKPMITDITARRTTLGCP